MAFEDTLRNLREFDVNDLDFDNVGSWPLVVKILIWILLLVALLAGGYYYHIEGLRTQLAKSEAEEQTLRREFEKKAFH